MAFAIGSASGPFVVRLFNALTLRSAFYRAVASDRTGTGSSAATLCLASLLRQSVTLGSAPDARQAWGLAILLIVLLAASGWLIYGLFGYALARLVSPTAVSLGAVVRTLGYAETVTITRVIAYWVEPGWYAVLHVILLAWSFAAVWQALHASASGSTARLVVIAVPTFIVQHAVLAAEQVIAFGGSPLEAPAKAPAP